MPTAAESGALLGVAYELSTNSLIKRPFCGGRCVLTMIAGAVIAGTVVRWDSEAKPGKEVDKERRGLQIHIGDGEREGKFGDGYWY